MPSDLIRDRASAAPYVTPFLDALDRMQERTTVRPSQLTERAEALLVERFGSTAVRADAAFAHGGTGLLGEHTHYFDGFAVLMSLPLGTAVAVRHCDKPESSVTFEGSTETWTFPVGDEPGDLPAWVKLVADVIRTLSPEVSQVEVAVVSTVPSSCVDAYVGALGIATARACQAAFASTDDSRTLEEKVRSAVENSLDLPYGIAYAITADEGRPDAFSLIDAHTRERLPLECPSSEILGWGLVDVGMGLLYDPSFHQKKRAYAEEAAATLRKKGFPMLNSLRELEHRDLRMALELLPRRYRPTVRHLVTENRRVQKLVAAIRRRDWQMFGALLLMSHASLQKDWESTNEFVDLIVREAEEMSLEGIYGACMSGRGGCVVIVGQPFVIPRCLDRIQESLRRQFDLDPVAMLL